MDDSLKDEQLESVTESVYDIQTTATPALTISSKASSSVTFSVTFPTSGTLGNTFRIWDFNVAQPVLASSLTPYGNNWYRTNGTYTISGLKPEGLYIVWMTWSSDGGATTGGENSICRIVQLPYTTTETLTRKDGTYVFTNIESTDLSCASTTNFNTWLDRLDSAYLALKDLVGSVPYGGNKIEIKSSRDGFIEDSIDGGSYWQMTWGWSGNPAELWQPFVRSHMLRLSNGDWGDIAIHEMSHDFDNYSWEFDPEFFADFKEYYVVESLGAKVYRTDTEKYYTGSSFANFFKTDQWYSYDNTFAYGDYSSRGLVSVFIRIKNSIGWQPFKDTFRYFNNLSSGQTPSSDIDKFNLFITKLKDYSGTDVIGLLTSNEKNVIQDWMGGTISYFVPVTAVPVSLNTPYDVSLSSGAYKVYKFTPSATGVYNIFTGPYAGTGGSNDTYLELYSDSGLTNKIAYDDDGGDGVFSKISRSLTGGTAYYIKLRPYSSSGALYTRFMITKEIPTINLNSPVDVNLPVGEYTVYKFIPSSTATYNIFTGPYGGTGGSNDTYLELYTDSGLTNKIAYDDDGGEGYFSKISKSLTGGTTYYIKLRHYSSSGAVHARLTATKMVIQTIYLNTPIDTQVATGEYNIFKFTPSTSGLYEFYTSPYGGTGSSSDTYLELYTDQNLTNKIAYDDDSSEGVFSLLRYELTASTSYYLKFRGYNNNSASAKLTVEKAKDTDADGIPDITETSGIPIGYDGKYITKVYLNPNSKDTDGDGLNDGVELIYLKHYVYDNAASKWYYEVIDNPNSSIKGSICMPDGIDPDYEAMFNTTDETIATYQDNILLSNEYKDNLYNYAEVIEEYLNDLTGFGSEQLYDYLVEISRSIVSLEELNECQTVSILSSTTDPLMLAWVGENTNYFSTPDGSVITGLGDTSGQGIVEALVMWNLWFGQAVHTEVEEMFLSDTYPNGKVEQYLPGPFKLRYDMMLERLEERELYEIKPISYSWANAEIHPEDTPNAMLGTAQLWTYIETYNLYNEEDSKPTVPGRWWNPNGRILPVPGYDLSVALFTFPNEPGMIYYTQVRKKPPKTEFAKSYALEDENGEAVLVFAEKEIDDETILVMGLTAAGVIVVGTVAVGAEVFTGGIATPALIPAAIEFIQQTMDLAPAH